MSPIPTRIWLLPDSRQGAFPREDLRLKWQPHVADLVYETEKFLPNQHLISSNYFNGFCQIDKTLRHVRLYSFHYTNPLMVERNYGLPVTLGMNATGMMASDGYVRQCWHTVLQSTTETVLHGYISVHYFSNERHETNAEVELAGRVRRISNT